jgi:hypothetical protein
VAYEQVRSVASRRFWDLFNGLPPEIQKLAIKNYELWRRDPRHPSLHFRRLRGSKDRFTVRIGDRYRALGGSADGTMTWVWIGTHSEYDRLVDS